jgi:3-oxoacyl-[acyl-carrier protein] reductase
MVTQMSEDLRNKHVVVTGGSRGLGRAMALSFAAQGSRVTITYKSNETAAQDVLTELERLGASARSLKLDIVDRNAAESLRTLDDENPVDILVNNAGEIPRPGNWDLLMGDDLDLTLQANLTGHIRCVQAIVPQMVQRKTGCVINIASTYALTGAAAVMAYTAAKAGLIAVTYSLARELGSSGVRVNAIAPGNFETAMAEEAGESFIEWVSETAPLGRLGTPSEIGEAAVFLASSSYITGHVLVVDGGHLLNM